MGVASHFLFCKPVPNFASLSWKSGGVKNRLINICNVIF